MVIDLMILLISWEDMSFLIKNILIQAVTIVEYRA